MREQSLAVLDISKTAPIGTAFWIGPRHILTCAHVVVTALGLPRQVAHEAQAPFDQVHVLGAGGIPQPCKIRHWEPIGQTGTGDLVVLSPDNEGFSCPHPVMLLDMVNLQNVDFQVFGYPEAVGEICAGRVLGRLTGNWAQLDGQTEQKIRGGYSGGPVFMPSSSAVIGMAVAATRDERKTAYMLVASAFDRAAAIAGSYIRTIPDVINIMNVRIEDIPDGGAVSADWLNYDLIDAFASNSPIEHQSRRMLNQARSAVVKVVGTDSADSYTIRPSGLSVWSSADFWWQDTFHKAFLKGPKMTAALLQQIPRLDPKCESIRTNLMRALMEGRAG